MVSPSVSATVQGYYVNSAVNEHGDVALLTDMKLVVISLHHAPHPTAVVVPHVAEERPVRSHELKTASDYFQDLAAYNNTYRQTWWLPSSKTGDYLLVLTYSFNFLMFHREQDSLQWTSQGKVNLKQFYRSNEHLSTEGFVDLFITGVVKVAETENGSQSQTTIGSSCTSQTGRLKTEKDEKSPLHFSEYHAVDAGSMPTKYRLGRRGRKKILTKRATKRRQPPVTMVTKIKQERDLVLDDTTVLRHVVRKSSTGKERLITYIMNSKDAEQDNDEEENVNCICGATEENSSEEEEWVECELCRVWQHMECVGYFPESQDNYQCDVCLKKETAKLKEEGVDTEHANKIKRGRPKIPPGGTLQSSGDTSALHTIQDGTTPENVTKATPSAQQVTKAAPSAQQVTKTSPSVQQPSRHDESGSASEMSGMEEESHINCPCGASESESGEEWVQCDDCDKWQHQQCVHYDPSDKVKYRCPGCTQLLFSAKPLPTSTTAPSNNPDPGTSNLSPPNLELTALPNTPKFRIPKRSKPSEPESSSSTLKIVGSSDLAAEFRQLQPVYIPKSLLGSCAGMIPLTYTLSNLGMKNQAVLSINQTNENKTPTTQNNNQNNTTTNNNNGALRNKNLSGSSEDCSDGENVTQSTRPPLVISESGEFVFVLAVFNEYVIVLRSNADSSGYPDLEVASYYQFRTEISSFAAHTVSASEYRLALADFTGHILIWDLEVFNDATHSTFHSSLPTLHPVRELTIESCDGCTISEIAWLNSSTLVLNKQQTIFLYDVTKASTELRWYMRHDVPFISGWYVSPSTITLYDNQGSKTEINVETKGVTKVKENVIPPGYEHSADRDMKAVGSAKCKIVYNDHQVLSTSVLPSSLLKVQISSFHKELNFKGDTLSVRYLSNLTQLSQDHISSHPRQAAWLLANYNVTSREDRAESRDQETREIEKSRDQDGVTSLSRDQQLREKFRDGGSCYDMANAELVKELIGDRQFPEDSTCYLCSASTLSPSLHPLLVTCSNQHQNCLDPETMSPLDPFSAQRCGKCAALNSELAVKCALCRSEFV